MFSKYDVYTTVQSMYCYPDTDVLINKLDIRDKAELKQAEEEFTAVKQMALLQEPIKGRFTKTHLFRIHRFLFEDVYPFAGHMFTTPPTTMNAAPFCSSSSRRFASEKTMRSRLR